jgi:hypothetical protein
VKNGVNTAGIKDKLMDDHFSGRKLLNYELFGIISLLGRGNSFELKLFKI